MVETQGGGLWSPTSLSYIAYSTATNPTTSSNITVAPSNITAATFNTFTCITAATSTNITAAAGLGS